MDSINRHKLLSVIRSGDYAHAGEEEAILLALQSLKKDANRLILDVGCGLGGTAKFIQDHGWGTVIGIDVDKDKIAYAKESYPEISFYHCDVLEVSELFTDKFDLFYFFNSFYSFPKQKACLKELRKVARIGANLVLFDYVALGDYLGPVYKETKKPIVPYPLKHSQIDELFNDTGWKIQNTKDLNAEYQTWYTDLVKRINSKKQEIVKIAGKDAFKHIHSIYHGILKEIKAGTLGGILIEAYAYFSG